MNPTNAHVLASSDAQEPIRAEVFGLERLEQHAESLAIAERIEGKAPRGNSILPRVRDNGRVLLAAYTNVAEAVQGRREISLAEEWFLDNYHVVDEQLREIRDHLPRGYYARLPKLTAGHLAGLPRVYSLSWAYVAHTDSRFEFESLQRFVLGYQRAQPLNIGELWAVAIHLRIALVENLRRITDQLIHVRDARALADGVADRLLGLSGHTPQPPAEVLGPLNNESPLSGAFTAQLVQRLRDQSSSITPAMEWLNERLAAQGSSAYEAVRKEHQSQRAANTTVRNIITSMRWMSAMDWLEFFESVSSVDRVLRAAPAYSWMDFATRDEYRRQIEVLSQGSGKTEIEVAEMALAAAGVSGRSEADEVNETRSLRHPDRPEEDPGYFLISNGRVDLEKRLGFRSQPSLRLLRVFRANGVPGYLGTIMAVSAAVLLGPLLLTWSAGGGLAQLLIMGLLGFVPASDVAVAVVNRFVAFVLPPARLPKLDLSAGVPRELKSLVVVPTLITSRADIDEQLERLDVHYLSNPEGHLQFALLTDFADGSSEQMPADQELVAALDAGLARLNERRRGPPGEEEHFLVFHRRRLWNETERKWMGWERKRGKLHELNRLLRGATDTSFMEIGPEPLKVPEDVRYVVTLDADTRISKGTAYELIGAMAHPLNRPRFDPEKGRVVEGYAVMQPRITASLPTGPGSTTYQRIVSGPGGG